MEAEARDLHWRNEGDPLPSHGGEPMHNPPRFGEHKHPHGREAGGQSGRPRVVQGRAPHILELKFWIVDLGFKVSEV